MTDEKLAELKAIERTGLAAIEKCKTLAELKACRKKHLAKINALRKKYIGG